MTTDSARDARAYCVKAPERRFTTIGDADCGKLLAANAVGRVAWQAADGPQVLPITYVWHGGRLVFRTSPHGILSELLRPTEVAIEVDDLDQRTRTGWSVVVHGQARAIAPGREIVDLWAVEGLIPWASGIRNLFIEVIPSKITGRQLQRDRAR